MPVLRLIAASAVEHRYDMTYGNTVLDGDEGEGLLGSQEDTWQWQQQSAAAAAGQAEAATTAAAAAALQQAAAKAEGAPLAAAAAADQQQQVGAADDSTGDAAEEFVLYSAEQLQQGLPGLQAAGRFTRDSCCHCHSHTGCSSQPREQ